MLAVAVVRACPYSDERLSFKPGKDMSARIAPYDARHGNHFAYREVRRGQNKVTKASTSHFKNSSLFAYRDVRKMRDWHDR